MNSVPLGTVSYIQNMLRRVSFHNENVQRIIPDGLYGQQTKESVASFQQAYGLYATGEVDNDTWDKLVEVSRGFERQYTLNICAQIFNESRRPIEKGDANPTLYVIQAMMLALSEKFKNIGTIFVTGIFDDATAEAVRRIQILSGITPNGLIDNEFANSLAELYNTYITRNRVENVNRVL